VVERCSAGRRFTAGRPAATVLRLALVVMLAAVAGTAAAVDGQARGAAVCARLEVESNYVDAVNGALAERRDVWGNELIESPTGPTYEGAQRFLHPLMLVGRPAGLKPQHLTDSGVYYLAFGQPLGTDGAGEVQLHVADGSQIVSELANGPRLSIDVGAGTAPRERYGSCLTRLAQPSLYGGYLPVLETTYVDADGVRYEQESFAARIPQTQSLVSLIRLTIDPRGSQRQQASVRLTPSMALRGVRGQLRDGRRARLLFSPGGRFDGRSLTYTTRGRTPRTVYIAWLDRPARTRSFRLGRAGYERARQALVDYWGARLAKGAMFEVPEQRVLDAERNLLIQNLLHSWRYSLGNAYERFSWELIDVAEVMGAYGFRGLQRKILETSLHSLSFFPNRAAGERMTGSADYYRRFGDGAYIKRVTPRFRRYVDAFERQVARSPYGILGRERYGADIVKPIWGLHAQVLALQGLRAMAGVWAETGHVPLATRAVALADRLELGLQAAVSLSSAQLPDGSFFAPISLYANERPYESLTDVKRGSYWNLVMPYVLASRFFSPGSPQAKGLLTYMLNHGSRFLGLVRFRPHTNANNPGYEAPGSDDVYGTNVSRFLADNDRPDQLVLSLYGKLAAGMTPETFVAGEGSTIAPVRGQYYRSMHRPPNSANNAFFLETLRLMLVHETVSSSGAPQGLELAFASPRAWLEPGKRIVVRGAPTSFGPLSYSLEAGEGSVRVELDVPERIPPSMVKLRLRLPSGERIASVSLHGRSFHGFDAADETIDLSGLRGHVELIVRRAARTRP
jgi:hypothetical protein